jgi:hypothetical protein
MHHAAVSREGSNQQPATSNQQPATSNLQPATCNQQPATCNLQPATCNLQSGSGRAAERQSGNAAQRGATSGAGYEGGTWVVEPPRHVPRQPKLHR